MSGSLDVLQGLVIAVDTKDRYTKRHSEDVARYAIFLAQRVGLDDEMLRTIHLAGLLHDIGKIGIPDVVLRKPSKLTDDEYRHVPAARGARRRDRARRAERRDRARRDPPSPRALGRRRLPRAPRGRGDPRHRPHPRGRRCVQRHDHDAPVSQGALGDRGTQAPRRRGRRRSSRRSSSPSSSTRIETAMRTRRFPARSRLQMWRPELWVA